MVRSVDDTLKALRANAESDDGDGFWMVYLDNARRKTSVKEFRSHLSQLAKRGDYKPQDSKFWGSVRLEPGKNPSDYH